MICCVTTFLRFMPEARSATLLMASRAITLEGRVFRQGAVMNASVELHHSSPRFMWRSSRSDDSSQSGSGSV